MYVDQFSKYVEMFNDVKSEGEDHQSKSFELAPATNLLL
jgi:hypothetical protein